MKFRAAKKSGEAVVSLPVGDAALQTVDTGGRLHPFWDHSVLFVANLLALFFGNEQQTRLLQHEIRGADSYGGRLLPILNLLYRGKKNVLMLERAPDAAMQHYFADELQLSLPRIEILSHEDYLALGESTGPARHSQVRALSDRFDVSHISFVDGYVTDATLTAIARSMGLPTVSTVEGSRHGNNKSLLHDALVAAGLPVFDSHHANSSGEVVEKIAQLKRLGYRSAVIKSALGASGIGIIKVRMGEDMTGLVPPMIFFEGPCLVQGWLETGVNDVASISSPSVQMFLNETQVALYDVTDQILSNESVHEGNESPPEYLAGDSALRDELFRQAGIAGRWLHRQGYRGTASVDFLVARKQAEAEPTVYVCEINARVTGATYPSVLARHFRPEGAWLMRNISLATSMRGEELLKMLRHHGRLFGTGDQHGILPINLNLGADDAVLKGQFLCIAGSVPECHALLAQTETDLGGPWRFDRD